MRFRLALLLIVSITLSIAACKSRRNDAPNPISGSPRSQPINGNRVTQVQLGMTKGQVRNLVGPPQSENTYKPWSLTPPGIRDKTPLRTEWHYRGRGTVTFTEAAQPGGTAIVSDVEIEDPHADASQ